MKDANGKEADELLEELHRDFDGRRCVALRHKRTKVAFGVMFGLIAILGVFITVSLLLFKSVIYPPTPLQLCNPGEYVIIPLGTNGGVTEDNLSSFLLSKAGSLYFLALDAGTIFTGLTRFVQQIQTQMAENHHTFELFNYPDWAVSIEQQTGWVMRNRIVGYFVGHPHLDHLTGLMAVAPEDYYVDTNGTSLGHPKSIIGLSSTLNAIESDLFNGIVWADFVSFGRYQYQVVEDGMVSDLPSLLGNFTQNNPPLGPLDFPNNVTVTTHQTCHDTLNSSAFLFTFPDTAQILFFSDTGVPSSVPLTYCNWTERLLAVWKSVNLINLKAILIEVSFPNSVPDSGMFGHLRPKDLMQQLNVLANIKGVKSLSTLTVIIEHIKPILDYYPTNPFHSDARQIIQNELTLANNLGVKFVFPVQGQQVCV